MFKTQQWQHMLRHWYVILQVRPSCGIKTNAQYDQHHVGPFAADTKPHSSVEYKVLEQHVCKPVAYFPVSKYTLYQILICNKDKCQEKDKRRNQLDRYLFLKKTDYLFRIPHDTCLVQHKTADEKEQRHSNLQKVFCDWRQSATNNVETQIGYVMRHDEEHRESSQCINIFNTFSTTCSWFYSIWWVHYLVIRDCTYPFGNG